MKDYLFYVRYCMSGLFVYHCKTDDPFHVMGEMTYRCPEHIDRLSFFEQTDDKLEFWNKEGYKIREWENKYEKENFTGDKL